MLHIFDKTPFSFYIGETCTLTRKKFAVFKSVIRRLELISQSKKTGDEVSKRTGYQTTQPAAECA